MNFEKNKQYRHLKMGHGYFSVVGFGCVVGIKKAVETFFEIKYDDDPIFFSVHLMKPCNLNYISEFFKKKGLEARYDHHDNDVQNMFITFSGKNITLDARGGGGRYEFIDKSLNPTKDELDNFTKIMRDYGVERPPQLIFYAYEES